MALTDIGTSAWPVMKTTGIGISSRISSALEVEAALARQPHIEYQAARSGGQIALQEGGGRGEDLDAQPDRSKQVPERFPQRGIVVDDENDRLVPACGIPRGRLEIGHVLASRFAGGASSDCTAGRLNRNIAPGAPFAPSAHTLPPCASMMVRQTASPIPMPPGLVVKNASNSRLALSGMIPCRNL